MKNIRFSLIACLLCVVAVSCTKDKDILPEITTNMFRLEYAPVTNNGAKVYLHYEDLSSRLLYEDGDKVLIRNEKGEGGDFVIKYRTTTDGQSPSVTENGWYAQGSTELTGNTFYAAFADGYKDNSYILQGNGPNFTFNFNSTHNSASHNNILLAGSSASGTVLKMSPACAIIRFKNTSGGAPSWVKVGFESSKIPKSGTISAETGKITAKSAWMSAVASNDVNSGDFLMMKQSHGSELEDYFYVAVPIVGDNVTTNLYFAWYKDGATTQYKISNATLYRGKVYTVGSERQSPFNAYGNTKYRYKVNGSGGHVYFSAGNLQAQYFFDGDLLRNVYTWRFAPQQYKTIGSSNANNIANESQWFDLFGYGTSGYSTYLPQLTSTNSTDYPAANLDANTDWGKYNTSDGIYFGSVRVTGRPWRVLTADEWSFLLNLTERPGKCGYATVDGVKGIIILPDKNKTGGTWNKDDELPSGPAFTAGYSSSNFTANNYDPVQWGTLEMAGAVFLPMGGYRNDPSHIYNTESEGRYWSSTYGATIAGFFGDDYYSNAVVFSNTTPSVGYTDNLNNLGYSVRLVIQAW